MECAAERDLTCVRRGFDYLAVFLAVLCFVGAVTGTIVFSRSYSAEDIDGFIEMHRALPVTFVENLVYFLLSELPYFAGLIFLALFVPGFLAAPAALFIGGLRMGVSVCCLYSACGLWGVLYAVPVVAVPALCFMFSRALLCHGSMLLSMQLFRCVCRSGTGDSIVGKLIIKIPLCAAIDLFAAAFAAFMRTILFRFIS